MMPSPLPFSPPLPFSFRRGRCFHYIFATDAIISIIDVRRRLPPSHRRSRRSAAAAAAFRYWPCRLSFASDAASFSPSLIALRFASSSLRYFRCAAMVCRHIAAFRAFASHFIFHYVTFRLRYITPLVHFSLLSPPLSFLLFIAFLRFAIICRCTFFFFSFTYASMLSPLLIIDS